MSWHVACIADVLVLGWNKSEFVVEETLVTVGEFVHSRESVAEKKMTKGNLSKPVSFSIDSD